MRVTVQHRMMSSRPESAQIFSSLRFEWIFMIILLARNGGDRIHCGVNIYCVPSGWRLPLVEGTRWKICSAKIKINDQIMDSGCNSVPPTLRFRLWLLFAFPLANHFHRSGPDSHAAKSKFVDCDFSCTISRFVSTQTPIYLNFSSAFCSQSAQSVRFMAYTAYEIPHLPYQIPVYNFK